jgi:hypothetical protein
MVKAYVKLFRHKETGSQADDLNFHLTNKKTVRMYYSQAKKEKVLSYNLGL